MFSASTKNLTEFLNAVPLSLAETRMFVMEIYRARCVLAQVTWIYRATNLRLPRLRRYPSRNPVPAHHSADSPHPKTPLSFSGGERY